MADHSRESSQSSFGEEEYRIEYIAGQHLDGEEYYRLEWDVQYFSSQEIDREALKTLLHGRYGQNGYGLSLIGLSTYQLWAPDGLTQADLDHCKETPENSDK
ncbi:hypothetical protein VP1G_04663 [Cytospora mali]|uniref:Uncharacterized protein n=1 Tax=Cytospora mali TaxID=578113 RepID=A0A194V0D7_CYTMA|nr:hypothetical protein VP1G_04663 [Valsa mali var. pyri (nom. inval.)]